MSSDTREIADKPDESRREMVRATQSNRERVNQDHLQNLVDALGDPQHPLHANAVSDLVQIGEPAVPALTAALSPNYPWLTSYRAAETLAQIGDGRASTALITALRHPNSNVRWSAVRALSEIGDTRTLLALRRVVNDDHGKTSWGESVSDTAQLALDRLQSRSALLRFSEPIKTALVFVIMLAVLAFAGSRVQALRDEFARNAPAPVVTQNTPVDPSASAAAEPTPEPSLEPSLAPEASAAPANDIVVTVQRDANVREGPGTTFRVIGSVSPDDELIVLGEANDWFRVRLGQRRAAGSEILRDEGYIAASLVSRPTVPVPPDAPRSPEASPSEDATATP